MAPSASTARLRLTYTYYIALLLLAAIAGRPAMAPIAEYALTGVAAVLVVIACFGRIWCSVFIAGHKCDRLITDGPYSACRHPLYGFSFLGALGLALATRSLVLVLITAAVLAVLLRRAARVEDEVLSHRHGAAFTEYARITPAWLPRWRLYRLPELINVKPAVFRKAFLDAGAFVVLYLLIEAARLLRQHGVFPTLVALP
jgi:protein-S-isoprenylcysteine O-methyltransferase Ste14